MSIKNWPTCPSTIKCPSVNGLRISLLQEEHVAWFGKLLSSWFNSGSESFDSSDIGGSFVDSSSMGNDNFWCNFLQSIDFFSSFMSDVVIVSASRLNSADCFWTSIVLIDIILWDNTMKKQILVFNEHGKMVRWWGQENEPKIGQTLEKKSQLRNANSLSFFFHS